MIKKIGCAFLTIALILLSSCDSAPQEYARTSFAFDTFVSIRIYLTNSADTPEQICDSAVSLLNELDDKLSAVKENSELSRINKNAYNAPVVTDSHTYWLIKNCIDLSRLTDGAFDITLGKVSKLWGFNSDNDDVRPDFDKIKQCAGKANYNNIEFNDEKLSIKFNSDNFELDLGAAAKGYALDMLNALFEQYGVVSGVVDFGGSIMTVGLYGEDKWSVSVTADESDTSVGTLKCGEAYISTSNASRRYKEYDGVKYHHIIDGRTAFPSDSAIKSCTVVADSGLISDALSTAVYVMGYENAVKLYDKYPLAEFIIVKENGDIVVTDGLKSAFTETSHG